MISYLCARGDAIADHNKEEKDRINVDLTKFVRENAENFINPTQVFFMLEQCDAIDWCHNKGSVELYGAEAKIKEAFAPSEIVYENRSFSNAGRGLKAIAIAFILCAIFLITTIITGKIREAVF